MNRDHRVEVQTPSFSRSIKKDFVLFADHFPSGPKKYEVL